MEINDYKEQFEETYHNFDVSDWHSGYFLKYNDDTHAENPGEDGLGCGTECTQHTLTVKSDVAQDVWITAHTWDRRCISKKCWSFDKLSNIMFPGDYSSLEFFAFGDIQLDKITMAAGEEK